MNAEVVTFDQKVHITFFCLYSALNIFAFLVHGYAVFLNDSNDGFDFNECSMYHDYMKGRLVVCFATCVILSLFLYTYMKNKWFKKSNSFIYNSIVLFEPETLSTFKINNELKNRKIYCVRCAELSLIIICILYQSFFFMTDTSVASQYVDQRSCYYPTKKIQWLDVSIILNLLVGTTNLLISLLIFILMLACRKSMHKRMSMINKENPNTTIAFIQ